MLFLGSKYAKIAFAAGALPRTPLGGAYSAPPDSLAGLRGPTSKGRGREGEGEGVGRGMGTTSFWTLPPPLEEVGLNLFISLMKERKK